MRSAWRERATGAALAVVVAGAYQLGRARADGIPTTEAMYFGATLDEGGAPVNAMRTLRVRLWDAATGGAQQCDSGNVDVMVTAGRARVALPAACTAAVQRAPDQWVELSVNGVVVGARSKLGAVPYAVEAQRADGLTDRATTRVTNPECPGGYTRDATATDIVLCRRALAGGAFDEVVRVGTGGAAFWVDRYEASVWQNADGSGAQYGAASDDYPAGFPDNGQARRSGYVYAMARRDVVPSRFLTWFQMQVACRASGKRLPTNEEWQAAAAGTDDPGASAGGGGACLTMASGPRETGRGSACASNWGAQDMVGNVSEETGDWVASPLFASIGPTPSPLPTWGTTYNGDASYFVASAVGGTGPSGERRLPSTVNRGGCYNDGVTAGAFSYAIAVAPSWASPGDHGFRCVIPRP